MAGGEPAHRMKRMLAMYEAREFADLQDMDLNLNINPEGVHAEPTLYDDNEACRAAVREALSEWETPVAPVVEKALRVMALYVKEKFVWHASNDILMTRIVELIFAEEFRAHPDGVYRYSDGHWQRIEEFTYHTIRRVEQVLGRAAFFFREMCIRDTARNWEDVFLVARETHLQAAQANSVDAGDFKMAAKMNSLWAREGGHVTVDLIRNFTTKGRSKDLLASFGEYFKQPRPQGNPTIDFEDCTLSLNPESAPNQRFVQIHKSPQNETYFGVPVALAFKPPEWAELKMREFLTTTFAGNPDGRRLDMAMEALCWYGEVVPQVQILFIGDGGNAKSAKTTLRANVFGESHMVMSPEVFQVPEEFRKQGCHFAFAKVVTHQECNPGVPLIEDVWKRFVSGEALACRALFGKVTEYFSWKRCGKYAEWNLAFPSIKGEVAKMQALRSFWRRLIAIRLQSTFTSDASKVDHDKKIFLEDADMGNFLESPVAKLVYIQKYLLPFIATHTPSQLKQLLKSPPGHTVEETMRVVAQMANGGVECPENAFTQAERVAQAHTAKELMLAVHADTADQRIIKSYHICQIKSLPGTYQPSTRSKSRLQKFEDAHNIFPYLFERQEKQIVRVDVNVPKLLGVLQPYPTEALGGSWEEWGEVWKHRAHLAATSSDAEWSLQEEYGYNHDTEAGFLQETINIVALSEALAAAAPEHKESIQSVLERFSQGARDGNFASVNIRYVRKMGLPGRRYAQGPSAQWIGRAARKKAFFVDSGNSALSGYVFVDIDIKNCFPQLLHNTIAEMTNNNVNLEFPIFDAFVTNYKQWRTILAEYMGSPEDIAKEMLAAIFHLARPKVELPFLWALAKEMHLLVQLLLAMDEHKHLMNMFADRKNPMATRLHYALASVEDAILGDVEETLAASGLDASLATYMFDGAVIKIQESSLPDLETVLRHVAVRWHVAFKAERF